MIDADSFTEASAQSPSTYQPLSAADVLQPISPQTEHDNVTDGPSLVIRPVINSSDSGSITFLREVFLLRPNLLPTDIIPNKRSLFLRLAAGLAMTLLSGCGTWIHDDIPDGDLGGTVSVDWTEEDRFIYRPGNDKLWFKPSFMSSRITPTEMYTDGGSVPRVLWNIPGLSPWALGPAYVIHDYIFLVHRCHLPDPEVANLTFEDSARVLAEVGKSLIARKLVKHDALNAIVWAVRTQYARDLWDKPGTTEDCKSPPHAFAKGTVRRVMEFKIPPRVR